MEGTPTPEESDGPETPRPALECLRCGTALEYRATREIDGAGGLLATLAGVFEGPESVAIYACPECGRLEFFLAGSGAAPPTLDVAAGQATAGPAPEGPPWHCAACNEAVPANFDVCWSCGVARGPVEPGPA